MPPASGFHDVFYEDMQCQPCGNTSFCSGGGRFACPAHSLTEFSHDDGSPSDVGDCVCVPGFNRTGDTCVLAPPGAFYYQEGLALPCPQHKRTYQHGPSERQQCVCVPGYITVGDTCEQCAADFFNPDSNRTECRPCPAHSSHTLLGSVVVTDCACDAGAYSVAVSADNVECRLCAGGYFKGRSGPEACATCENNTFSDGLGASTCVSCHAASYAPAGSDYRDDCECGPGFEDEGGGACNACDAGKFKNSTSHDACGLCRASEYQDAPGQTGCLECGAYSLAQDSRVSCRCVPGYTSSPPGSLASAPVCASCPAHHYKPEHSQQACTACGTFMESPRASPHEYSCLCKVGYAFTGFYDTCVACEAGTYKDTRSNHALGLDCIACPEHSLSPNTSTNLSACACNAGFTPGPLQVGCEACGTGHFKRDPGGDACEPCAKGTYNPNLNATKCYDCYLHSDSARGSDELSDCVCDPGDTLVGGECVSCEPGKFADSLLGQCVDCENGKYTDVLAQTECAVCHPKSASYDEPHVACQCNAGFFLDDDDCDACAHDSYKTLHGNHSCTACQPDSQSHRAATQQYHCQCNTGYAQEGRHACAACGVGSYSDALNSSECTVCEAGKFVNDVAQTQCVLCWNHSLSSASRSGCECVQGHTPPVPGPSPPDACQLCAANTYKDSIGNDVCSECMTNSESGAGSTDLAQCECLAGFTLLGGECEVCAVGFYKAVVGNAACTRCPETLTTEFNQSDSQARCVCRPGFANVDGACEACPADRFQPAFRNGACAACRQNSSSPVDSLADDQYDCLCDAGFRDAPNADGAPTRECEPCAPGQHKSSVSNTACVACGEDTFSLWAAATCTECGASSSTHGLGSQALCDCVRGFARLGRVESECERCVSGTFKEDHRLTDCSDCVLCGLDEEVVGECNSTHQIACAACPAHSSSLGRNRTRAGPCDCDAGYQYQDGECVACVPGTYKDHTNNSYPCIACPDGEFTTQSASASCSACSDSCEAVQTFVTVECAASSDVVCAACQTCVPGSFDQPSCGLAWGNDREDTVCGECTPGYHCAGGAHRERCTNNAHSAAGSSSVASCGCVPGFVGDELGCEQCGFDTYCSQGVQHACPTHSVTRHRENTVVYECHCHHGFYRVTEPTPGADNFTCAVCTVDDYCFDNSRYNCSDERMSAARGSDARSDCRCADGFYNNANNTECLDCEADHFCVNGTQFSCGAAKWTQGQTRQDVCTCRPGARAQHDGCVSCGFGSFCQGDDLAELCRPHSETLTATASAYEHCLCSAGHGETREVGAPRSCVLCDAKYTFKTGIDNLPCTNCTRCSAAGIFTNVWCEPVADATCDACDACSAGEEFTDRGCEEFADARCAACHQCNFATEFQWQACQPNEDRKCQAFTTDATACEAGFYRGGHTRESDSLCLPCRYNDTRLNNQTLHSARTAGAEYDNAYSCGVACLGNSRWRDAERQYLGCVTCEVGNVLLKVFPVNMAMASTCQFECRPGYERTQLPDGSEDCYIPRLLPSPSSEFSHRVTVADYSWSRAVSRVRLAHTGHGYFAIVVGRGEPVGCRRGALSAFCCFAAHWRVSTLAQMGLTAAAPEACVGLSGLEAARESRTALEFSVPDAMLGSVATCSVEEDVRVCVVDVSLVDVITWKVTSTSFELRTRRSVTTAYFSGVQQMLPLSLFDVRVALWRVLASGEHVFRISTVASGAALHMQTRVLGMTQLAGVQGCDRLSLSNDTVLMLGDTTLVVPHFNSSTVSYWQAGTGLAEVKIIFHLAMLGEPLNVMDVAAVRDVRHLLPECVPGAYSFEYQTGTVVSAAGLGEGVVFRMRRRTGLESPGTVHGVLGTLITFVAESAFIDNPTIALKRVLAAHIRTRRDAHRLANATVQSHGVVDFTFEFRSWCLATPHDCHYEYINVHPAHSNLFELSSCAADEQVRATAWLRRNFGVVHDAGHIAAVCARRQDLLPYKSLAVLVNSMKYTSRQRHRWDMYQSMSTVQVITSYMWADFRIHASHANVE